VSVENLRVLAGDTWGQKLSMHIEQSSLPAFSWAKRNLEILKETSGTLVGLVDLDGKKCYLKYYPIESWQRRLWFKAGLSRGSKSYAKARVLLNNDILVPRPYTCVLARHGLLLLTEAIHQAVDLQTLWDRGQASSDHECWELAGGSLAKLHTMGFFHGDFKWSNLLLAESEIYLVDLEAVGELSRNSKKRYRDIARFTLNAEDMAAPVEVYRRSMQAYFAATGLQEREVTKHTLPILNRLRARHLKKYGPRGHLLMGMTP